MGGNYFTAEGYITPRMPPEIYDKISGRILKKLKEVYNDVIIPIEAPGKTSHGDIDFLVLRNDIGNHQRDYSPALQVAKDIGAVAYGSHTGSPTMYYLVPWPVNDDGDDNAGEDDIKTVEPIRITGAGTFKKSEIVVNNKNHEERQREMQKKPGLFVQVDVHCCTNAAEFTYLSFRQAHGDFAIIINSLIQPHGLVLTDKGLHLYIHDFLDSKSKHEPEDERNDKTVLTPDLKSTGDMLEDKPSKSGSLARVFVTNCPTTILEFLGLNSTSFWRRFGSYDELMDYISYNCHFFQVPYDIVEETVIARMPVAATTGTVTARDAEEELNGKSETDRQKDPNRRPHFQNHPVKNKRQRRRIEQLKLKRPMYTYYREKYLPSVIMLDQTTTDTTVSNLTPRGKYTKLTPQALLSHILNPNSFPFSTSLQIRHTQAVQAFDLERKQAKLWTDLRALITRSQSHALLFEYARQLQAQSQTNNNININIQSESESIVKDKDKAIKPSTEIHNALRGFRRLLRVPPLDLDEDDDQRQFPRSPAEGVPEVKVEADTDNQEEEEEEEEEEREKKKAVKAYHTGEFREFLTWAVRNWRRVAAAEAELQLQLQAEQNQRIKNQRAREQESKRASKADFVF